MAEWKIFRTLTRKIRWESTLTPNQEDILSKPPLYHVNRVKSAAAKVEFCQNKIRLYSEPLDIAIQNSINTLCQRILKLYPNIFK